MREAFIREGTILLEQNLHRKRHETSDIDRIAGLLQHFRDTQIGLHALPP